MGGLPGTKLFGTFCRLDKDSRSISLFAAARLSSHVDCATDMLLFWASHCTKLLPHCSFCCANSSFSSRHFCCPSPGGGPVAGSCFSPGVNSTAPGTRNEMASVLPDYQQFPECQIMAWHVGSAVHSRAQSSGDPPSFTFSGAGDM
jgi:hypothetical protein